MTSKRELRRRIGLLVIGVAVVGGCRDRDCYSDPPAIRVNLTLGAGINASQVDALQVELTVNGKTKDLGSLPSAAAKLADGASSFEIMLGEKGTYTATLKVVAQTKTKAHVASASKTFDAGADSCVVVDLILAVLSADGGPADLGPRDARPDADTCGNKAIDPPEQCDDEKLNGKSCRTLGAAGGTLRCHKNCTFDQRGCTWAVQGAGDGEKGGGRIAAGLGGNVVVAGYFSDKLTFGSTTLTSKGKRDMYVVRLGPGGTVTWARSFGSDAKDSDDHALGVATDGQDNVYITGSFTGRADFGGKVLTARLRDAFVVKLNAVGKTVWAVPIGGTSDDQGDDLASDGKGNLYLTGLAWSTTVDFGDSSAVKLTPKTKNGTLYVAKLDTNGRFAWAKSGGDGASTFPRKIAVGPSGGATVAGFFYRSIGKAATASFGGTTLTCNGCTTNTTTYRYTNFVAALSADGASWRWAKTVGHRDGENSGCCDPRPAVAVDGRGQIHYISTFQGSATLDGKTVTSGGSDDIVVARFDNTGKVLWATRAGGTGSDRGNGVAADAQGNSLVTGQVIPKSGGALDIYLARLADADGATLWRTEDGGAGYEQGCAVIAMPKDRLVVAGTFTGAMFLSGTPQDSRGTSLTAKTATDIFVWKLNLDGSYP